MFNICTYIINIIHFLFKLMYIKKKKKPTENHKQKGNWQKDLAVGQTTSANGSLSDYNPSAIQISREI